MQFGWAQQVLSLPPCTSGVRPNSVVPGALALIDTLYVSSVDMADPSKIRLRTSLRLGGLLGFVGGFLFAYQRSSREYNSSVPPVMLT